MAGASAGAAVARVAEVVRPVALAREQVLEVLPALGALLPDGGLRRGGSVAVAGGAATSLALALAAGPSQAGSWTAVVGLPSLGLAAAAELGVVLERLTLVPAPPPSQWATVVATALDAFDVVLLGPAPRARAGDVRRLAARARERGAAMVLLGPLGDLAADVVLTATAVRWEGVGEGEGHLRARRVAVQVTGRGRASRGRAATLWLPDHRGAVRVDAARDASAADEAGTGPDAEGSVVAWRRTG